MIQDKSSGYFEGLSRGERMPAEDLYRVEKEMFNSIDKAEKCFFDILKEERGKAVLVNPNELNKIALQIANGLSEAVYDFFHEQNIPRDQQTESNKMRNVVVACQREIFERTRQFVINATKSISANNFEQIMPPLRENFKADVFNLIMATAERSGVAFFDSQLFSNKDGILEILRRNNT